MAFLLSHFLSYRPIFKLKTSIFTEYQKKQYAKETLKITICSNKHI